VNTFESEVAIFPMIGFREFKFEVQLKSAFRSRERDVYSNETTSNILAPCGAKCTQGVIEQSTRRTLRSSRARTGWKPEAINILLRRSEGVRQVLMTSEFRSLRLNSRFPNKLVPMR
jgi:hypothetical protein